MSKHVQHGDKQLIKHFPEAGYCLGARALGALWADNQEQTTHVLVEGYSPRTSMLPNFVP